MQNILEISVLAIDVKSQWDLLSVTANRFGENYRENIKHTGE